MKNTISYVITALLFSLIIILSVQILNAFSVINMAEQYHQNVIADIQASNYAAPTIAKYTNNTQSPFRTEIENVTIENLENNIQKTGRLYKVVTEFQITIPLIQYRMDKKIIGYAR